MNQGDRLIVLEELAAHLGIAIGDEKLWNQALTHPSYSNEKPGHECYERLEFLGDAIVGAAVAQILFEELPGAPPGELTFLRSVLVRRENLSRWAAGLPLLDLIRTGKGVTSIGETGQSSILGDIAEALIAVVYLENGYGQALQLVRSQVVTAIPSYQEARLEYEPKNILQEILAARNFEPPQYEVVSEEEDGVTVSVSWGEQEQLQTMARSKKEASVQVARKAVEMLLQDNKV